jgi:uncharacterized protein (DUF433 family)/DNA-binding transcriptional MerR regulator
MAFPVPIASVLTGATPRQLGYWRRKTTAAPPLLVPEAERGGRYLYSWADVVALRSIVYLRRKKSLPKIRRAVAALRQLEADDWEHLAEYRLVRTAETIIVQTPRGDILDLERSPGTILDEILMEDVLGPFKVNGTKVPALRQPRPHLAVHPRILNGFPVIAGSRVPFHLVAALADEGASSAEIVEIYPSVDPRGVPDAQDFAHQVARASA